MTLATTPPDDTQPPTSQSPSYHPAATNDPALPRQVLIQLALALIIPAMTDYQRGHCLRRGLDEWGRD